MNRSYWHCRVCPSLVLPFLSAVIPYKELPRAKVKLGKRDMTSKYDDDVLVAQRNFIPQSY